MKIFRRSTAPALRDAANIIADAVMTAKDLEIEARKRELERQRQDSKESRGKLNLVIRGARTIAKTIDVAADALENGVSEVVRNVHRTGNGD